MTPFDFSQPVTLVGFSRWKRGFLPNFFDAGLQLRFIDRLELDLVNAGDQFVLWSNRVTPELAEAILFRGAKLWRMEDGFVRSVGLGVDLVEPLSLVLDSKGIYYDSTQPSDLECLLNEAQMDSALLTRAAQVSQRLIHLGISKYNVGLPKTLDLPKNKRIILVPGQVETDASIRLGSPDVKTNLELLKRVRTNCPDAFIIYKPHPDVVGGGRIGEVNHVDASAFCDVQITDVAMPALLSQVDEVHTITSLTGFEALIRQIPVVTYGLPFYAGWGLTQDHFVCERRTAQRSLHELIAATLILYPIYVLPGKKGSVDVEDALEELARQKIQNVRPTLKTRLYRLIRKRI
ncbi:hypothetical protein GCM10026986_05930 [Nitrincola alkalisediminis]